MILSASEANHLQRIKDKFFMYSLTVGLLQNMFFRDEDVAVATPVDVEAPNNIIADYDEDDKDDVCTIDIEEEAQVKEELIDEIEPKYDDSNVSDDDDDCNCLCDNIFHWKERTYCGKTRTEMLDILAIFLAVIVFLFMIAIWFVLFFTDPHVTSFLIEELHGK